MDQHDEQHPVAVAALRAGDVATWVTQLPADETWRLVHPMQDIDHGHRPMAVIVIGETMIIQMPTHEMGQYPEVRAHGHPDTVTAHECAIRWIQTCLPDGWIITQGPLVDAPPMTEGEIFAAIVAQAREAGYPI